MSLCILAGFVIAEMLIPLYGGDTVSQGIVEPEILHIPIGVFMFYSAFIIQIFTLSLLRYTQAKLKDL